MSKPESSILAADDDWADDGGATFISDLSIGSLFTKSLLILLFVFFVIRLSITIYRHCRRDSHQPRGYAGNNVPGSAVNNPDDHHDEENPVQNDEEATTSRAFDVEVVISLCPNFMYGDEKADDRNNTTCPICMCEYLESDMMRMLPQCGHYFHLKCIDEWLRISWSCPVCRDSPLLPQATPSTSSSGDQ
ncbi:RING-H2 finger protein ATL67-like [Prosopis cineraria]|uniref:RING-H2 finger protein ATL67-like n=1 Tax=Prosopis cineraria TaxID=364024 RepID=UPI00240EEF6A|nr:RING-H2 finger protein ATL67-like [Prosopis cineraria]